MPLVYYTSAGALAAGIASETFLFTSIYRMGGDQELPLRLGNS